MNIGGDFFFNKTQKKRKKKKKKTFKRKKKERKWGATNYPYRDVTKGEAIKDFLTLRKLVQQKDWNAKSIAGNALIDWGTEKARRKTRYRNRSFIEKWNNKTRRKKMLEFAKRIKRKDPRKSVLGATRAAIDLQWGTVNTLRAAAAACMNNKY